jgi:flagellar motility protein MotE (MotC chaperone)
MARLLAWSRVALLVGCFSLSGQVPASAQTEQTPAKPLNLIEFTKPTATARPRQAARPAPSNPRQAPPLTTGTVAKAATASSDSAAEPSAQQESDAAKFCANFADAALDARVAWQQKQLEVAEDKLRQRIAELEAKRAEYEQWLKLREDFLRKAEDSVVEIYSRMNPDAAAQQIASMADNTAAAVLAKLKVRSASAILNEMEPARGAHLADTLAGMRRSDDGKPNK